MTWEPERLGDTHHLTEGDPGGMLRAVADSAAQVRTGYRCAVESGVDRLSANVRPRAVVVAGMGGSALAGDILAAVCGPGAPIPVVTVRSYQLPGWVGATDLVIAVSWSGETGETLAMAAEAVRRGCTLLAVGPAGSALEAVAVQSSSLHVAIPTGRSAQGRPVARDDPAGGGRRLAEAGAGRADGLRAGGQDARRHRAPLLSRPATRSSTPARRWRWTWPNPCR
ncbi:hypothetical protein ACFSTC_49215 [Nonomuraea ferruginea]